jgi:hypothetical protein
MRDSSFNRAVFVEKQNSRIHVGATRLKSDVTEAKRKASLKNISDGLCGLSENNNLMQLRAARVWGSQKKNENNRN